MVRFVTAHLNARALPCLGQLGAWVCFESPFSGLLSRVYIYACDCLSSEFRVVHMARCCGVQQGVHRTISHVLVVLLQRVCMVDANERWQIYDERLAPVFVARYFFFLSFCEAARVVM